MCSSPHANCCRRHFRAQPPEAPQCPNSRTQTLHDGVHGYGSFLQLVSGSRFVSPLPPGTSCCPETCISSLSTVTLQVPFLLPVETESF